MFGAAWTDLMQSNYEMALGIAKQKEPEVINMFFQPNDYE
jgi:hypothetical protein